MEDVKEGQDKPCAESKVVEKVTADSTTPAKRKRRTKAEMEADNARLTMKRKRGRPRKNEIVKAEGGNGVLVVEPKPRKKKEPLVVEKRLVDLDCVGKSVTGVLDGCFESGYLVTVRIGDTDTVLRGVLFDPSATLPISTEQDGVPGVKTSV